jgi:LysM repeat protein
MTKVIDLTRQTMGWNNPFQTRRANQITRIARHHSATAGGDVFTFENHWRTLGWRNGGYSEIILRDGTVQLCYVPEVVTNGVAGHNLTTYNICLVGNGSFTEAQEQAFEERARFNMQRFNISVTNVLGHNEFTGTATACPGSNMSTVRSRLNNTNNNNNQNNGNQQTHLVRGGETLTSIAHKFNVTVEAIAKANQITNVNLIRTGQVLTIPESNNNNSSGTTAQQFFPATQAGSGIVDALKAINVDSTFANRQRIANANEISNYSGTATQNNQLLSLLRAGRLVRP